ncbi:hypothetical protein AB6A40_000184 [Gnathostoma spinigerum]|uniref:Rap-GAP domain-containing protein n=1 Tax=Gnathostoma spinigerum TaxID=75299 RepID=A0ABD6E1K1_9BILA
MYDEWPVISFPRRHDGNLLSMFTKEARENVVALLMKEISDHVSCTASSRLRIENEEDLTWIMKVITYSLSLSFTPDKEYNALHAAVQTCTAWSTILTQQPHCSVPKPLASNREKYIEQIFQAMEAVFFRRTQPFSFTFNPESELCVCRQALEIRSILESVRDVTAGSLSEHMEFVWMVTLRFLLASSDSLLSGQSIDDGVCTLMGPAVIETLLNQWIRAARLQYIPSPSYWKTLSLCMKRWRHQIAVLESWSRKIISLTVLVVQGLYGTEYCLCDAIDEEVKLMSISNGKMTKAEQESVLHQCWILVMHLLGNPSDIIEFNPTGQGSLSLDPIEALVVAGGKMDTYGRPHCTESDSSLNPQISGRLRLCFFIACMAVSKVVDVFYGDANSSVSFRESAELRRMLEEPSRRFTDARSRQPHHRDQLQQRSNSGPTSADEVNGGLDVITPGSAAVVDSDGADSLVSSQVMKNSSGTQSSLQPTKSHALSDLSMPSNTAGNVSMNRSASDMPHHQAKPTSGQIVWHYLKRNKVHPAYIGTRQPRLARMLDMFMEWLVQSAIVKPVCLAKDGFSDVISQRSTSSVGMDEQATDSTAAGSGGESSHVSTSDSAVNRRHVAYSTSSSDVHSSFLGDKMEIDGISAGRAAAIGTLCRIICSKMSDEIVPETQLAQFYKLIYECLLEKDRLILCTFFYFGSDIFRLGLRGVHVLLPLFINALDTILVESSKLRLHPSIDEVEMRRICLQALSSVISWPTTFGPARIPDPSHYSFSSSGGFMEEHSTSFIELRSKIHRTLIASLRNENDPTNLYLSLSMCNILCEESCNYDLCNVPNDGVKKTDSPTDEYYTICILRSVVSAICDNLCKPHWSSELSVCLSALDCLNAISNLNPVMLFPRKDVSTGSLIVTSLCRFIDTQLSRPPPYHSRDLHSSVVAAYGSLAVWLCASPVLMETEACLNTVAETIEFGLTGGKNLPVNESRPASKRVQDAAEYLLHKLFSAVGHPQIDEIVDEKTLSSKYSSNGVKPESFRHFLIKKSTLISLHEATYLTALSQGAPTVFAVVRTPYHNASAFVAKLRGGQSDRSGGSNEYYPEWPKLKCTEKPKEPLFSPLLIPSEFSSPECKLDSVIPSLKPNADSDYILSELREIRKRMAKGESCVEGSDKRNVWLQKTMQLQLQHPFQILPKPKAVDVGRVFLYDMGFISEETYANNDFVMLDSSNSSEFYNDLHQLVDRCPVRLLLSIYVFYVARGQRVAADILKNGEHIETTSGEFCELLSELGEGVDVANHLHWTGNWKTAFSNRLGSKEDSKNTDHYTLDGQEHCLWWADAHVEIAYTVPTEKCKSKIGEIAQTFDHSHRRTAETDSVFCYRDSDVRAKLSQGVVSESVFFSDASNEIDRQRAPPPGAHRRDGKKNSQSSVNSDVFNSGATNDRGYTTIPKRSSDQRILIVWLESIEDMNYFPLEAMTVYTHNNASRSQQCQTTDLIVLFLNQLENGLVLVRVKGAWTKYGLPGPLFDGCVVSNRSLPLLIRKTAVSIVRKSTVELENYQMASLRRKQRIQEFARRYSIKQSYTDALERLMNEYSETLSAPS